MMIMMILHDNNNKNNKYACISHITFSEKSLCVTKGEVFPNNNVDWMSGKQFRNPTV